MKAVVWTALGGFIIAFAGTLYLHYRLRPPAPPPMPTDIAAPANPTRADTDTAELKREQTMLIERIDRLQAEIGRLRGQQSLARTRAGVLMEELERHQSEQDAFLAAYTRRSSEIKERLAELDRAIADQVASQDRDRSALSDLDARARLDTILDYPHPLNDNPTLLDRMRDDPRGSLPLAERHYTLLVRPTDYPAQEALRRQLMPILTRLDERYGHRPEILALHCDEVDCELQLKMNRPERDLDYWRATRDALAELPGLGGIDHQLVVETPERITGMLIIRRIIGE